MAERDEIRLAVVEFLKGATDAGLRVSPSRARAAWEQGLPAIAVYTKRERFEISVESPREYMVETDVVVDLFVTTTATGPADDELDRLSKQVFRALTVDPTLGLDQFKIRPADSSTDFGIEGKRKLGGDSFVWRATHYRLAPEGEDGELGDFRTLHVENDLEPADGKVDAVDDVNPDQ